ncbi:hypothetical protein [Microcoleus sp. PH2017_22_RUC_O_B]|uniref:hypothetical protein n=1 Tax=Microcoleus sp. PH2017_22_RUC_O_B TaxID=2798833 RepID=UPI0025D29AA5|nr:hypothetical protein [Microcoleus sp. PH2017_22_RUC_O_B]
MHAKLSELKINLADRPYPGFFHAESSDKAVTGTKSSALWTISWADTYFFRHGTKSVKLLSTGSFSHPYL